MSTTVSPKLDFYGSLFFRILVGMNAVAAIYDLVENFIRQTTTAESLLVDGAMLLMSVLYLVSIRARMDNHYRSILEYVVLLMMIGLALYAHLG